MMNPNSLKTSAVLVLYLLISGSENSSFAQNAPRAVSQTIGATHGQIAGAFAGIAGAGTLIGILGYVAVKHNHSLTGYVRSSTDGMELTSESNQQTYALVGDAAGIKPGDRVRVSGRKSKEHGGTRQFLVQKLSNDFGPCEVSGSSR